MVWIKFLVLLIVFVIKSNAMSYGEIEDFSNFLRRTSQLDQTIKKNIFYHIFQNYIGGTLKAHPVGVIGTADEDDDDLISDNAWEESGKFEGDLILNERQRRLIVEDVAVGLARNGLRDSTKKWPGNEVVFYIQPEHFSKEQTQAIQEGMDELARVSCVSFRPYKKGDKDAVVIQGNRRGCFSQVGYQGGYQVLNLSGRHPVGRGCFRPGTVVHELLHTLGFYHMQSSPDRDDYVDVLWDNIIDQAKNNFRKYNAIAVSDYGVGYDYDSVLHYSRRAFSSNGLDTLVPKQKEAEIGQRLALSEKDILKLNKMYCNADPNNFDADEVLTKRKSGSKKNNAKNKPFEGRGLGYQKGKPIVIRLPTAKNYRLNDHNILEYLSQLPQTVLSPSLDGRRVKEIEKSKINVPLIVGQNKNAAVLETILDSATRNDESEENNELYRFIKPLGDITYVVRPDGTIQQEDERNIEDEEHSKLPSTYLLQNDIKHWNKLKTALNYDPLRLHLFSNKDILVKPKEGVTHETLRHELPTKEKKSKLHKANKKGMSTNRFLEEYNNDRLNQNYNMLLSGPVTLIENFYRPNEERTYLPSNDKSRKESQQSTGVTSFAPRDSYSKSKYIKLNRSNLDKETDDKKINIKVSRAGVLPQEIKKYNKIREKQLDDSKIPPTSENSPAVLNKDRAPSKDTYTDYDDYSAIKSNVQNHYPSSLKDYNNYDNFDVTAPYYDISQQSRVLYSDIHSNPYQSSIEDDWDHSYEKYEYPFNLEHSRHNS